MNGFFCNIHKMVIREARAKLDSIPSQDAESAIARLSRTTISEAAMGQLKSKANSATLKYVEAANRVRIIAALENRPTSIYPVPLDGESRTYEMLEEHHDRLVSNRENESHDVVLDKMIALLTGIHLKLYHLPGSEQEEKIAELNAMDEDDVEGLRLHAKSVVNFYIAQKTREFTCGFYQLRKEERLTTKEIREAGDSETKETTERDSVDLETSEKASESENNACEDAAAPIDSPLDLSGSEDVSPAALSTEPENMELEPSAKASKTESDACESVDGLIDSSLAPTASEDTSAATLSTEPGSVDLVLSGKMSETGSDACDESAALTNSPMDVPASETASQASLPTSEAYSLAKSAKKKEKRARQRAQRKAPQVKEEKAVAEEEHQVEDSMPGDEETPAEGETLAEEEVPVEEDVQTPGEEIEEYNASENAAQASLSTADARALAKSAKKKLKRAAQKAKRMDSQVKREELPTQEISEEESLVEEEVAPEEEKELPGTLVVEEVPAEEDVPAQEDTAEEISPNEADEHHASLDATTPSLSDSEPQPLSKSEKKKQKRAGQKARKMAAQVEKQEVPATDDDTEKHENEHPSAAWEAAEEPYAVWAGYFALWNLSPSQVMFLMVMVVGVLIILWASVMRMITS